MGRKNDAPKGLGNALRNEKKKMILQMKAEAAKFQALPGEFGSRGPSVLEQTDLDELIATVAIRKEEWDDEMGEAEFVAGPTLLTVGATAIAEKAAIKSRELVSIPRRPEWHDGMSAEELAASEAEAFMDWRRELAEITGSLFLTPYERNLDFWRQLWRCMERSDLLVQIVDARDPDFYFCRDLVRYVEELGGARRMVLLANKADFLTDEQRQRWAAYFESRGVDTIFFSALREMNRQEHEKVEVRGRLGLTEKVAAVEASAKLDTSAAVREVGKQHEASVFAEMTGLAEDTDPAIVDGTDVPVPGLSDSDDDLKDEPAQRSDAEGDEGDEDVEEENEEEEEEEEKQQQKSAQEAGAQNAEEEERPVMGQLAEDDLAVADATRLIEELCSRLPSPNAETRHRGTIGFVGYPNVGKSTVINALLGAKRVAMSKRPGKTKHIQTMDIPELGVTLCDCPGLVFPSVVASRAYLVMNNTVPLDDLRECFAPISIIIDKMGWANLLKRYECTSFVEDARLKSGDHVLDDTHAFLAAFALSRGKVLRLHVPDENWAARKVLRDYVSGALLHVEEPPTLEGEAAAAKAAPQGSGGQETSAGNGEEPEQQEGGEEGDGDGFGDLDAFLEEQRNEGRAKHMTKRKMRFLQKHSQRKGIPIEAADGVNFIGRSQNRGEKSF